MMTIGVSSVAISFRLTYYYLQNEWSIHGLRFFSEHFNQYTKSCFIIIIIIIIIFILPHLNYIYTHNSER